jgi:hypothetical protein
VVKEAKIEVGAVTVVVEVVMVVVVIAVVVVAVVKRLGVVVGGVMKEVVLAV